MFSQQTRVDLLLCVAGSGQSAGGSGQYHAKFGAAPLLDSFTGPTNNAGNSNAVNTANPASEASYRSGSSYRPTETTQDSGTVLTH